MMELLKEKLWSRKLIAFITATVALWFGVINQGAWENVAIAYLGAQGLVDLTGKGLDYLKAKAKDTAVEASE